MESEKRRLNCNKGFSLIELIIVIAIMAVLVAVIAPSLVNYLALSKKRLDETNASEIKSTVNKIVIESLTMEDRKDLFDNINDNYNGKIILVEPLIRDIDATGEFEREVRQKLGSNDFECKRDGYNFYLQIKVSDNSYDVVCKSVKADATELSDWP